MGRKPRRILAAAWFGARLAFLALTCAAATTCVVLWAKDWARLDGTSYRKWNEGIVGYGSLSWVGTEWEFRSYHGCLRVDYRGSRYDRTLDPAQRERLDTPGIWYRYFQPLAARYQRELAEPPESVWAQMGFAFRHTYSESPSRTASGAVVQETAVSLTVPNWAVALLFSVPLLWAIQGRWRRSRRVSAGRCGRCGYDLRGGSTTGRCPECGMAVLAQWLG